MNFALKLMDSEFKNDDFNANIKACHELGRPG